MSSGQPGLVERPSAGGAREVLEALAVRHVPALVHARAVHDPLLGHPAPAATVSFVDPTDRGTAAIFADGAGAALVSPRRAGGRAGSVTSSCAPTAPARPAIRARHDEQIIHMQGHDTFKAAVHRMSEATIEATGRRPRARRIGLFVYHQANARILTAVGERLGLDARARDQLDRPLREHLRGHAAHRPHGRARAWNGRARHERAARRLRRGLHVGRGRDRMGGMNGRPDGSALVTGASRGIGAAIARALAREGWPVGVNYRSDEDAANAVVDEIVQAGGRAKALHGDVSDPATADALFSALEEEFGPVLVLVNNAGVRADGLAPMINDDDWNRVVDTNLSAAFRLTRRALRPMIRSRYGRIVNIASIVGAARRTPGQANYAASKAGLVAMTRTVAAEVARRGVTVNAVAPGLIETDMTEDIARRLAGTRAGATGRHARMRSPNACASSRPTAPRT